MYRTLLDDLKMELFIKLDNGVPVEHPIMGDNFRQAFPNIDVNNLPSTFAKFVRVAQPPITVYEINDGFTYDWQDGVVTDVWHIRPMTDEEKLELQTKVKAEWETNSSFKSWTFDDATCSFLPPVPHPTDGKHYIWDESILNWTEINDI